MPMCCNSRCASVRGSTVHYFYKQEFASILRLNYWSIQLLYESWQIMIVTLPHTCILPTHTHNYHYVFKKPKQYYSMHFCIVSIVKQSGLLPIYHVYPKNKRLRYPSAIPELRSTGIADNTNICFPFYQQLGTKTESYIYTDWKTSWHENRVLYVIKHPFR